MSTIVTKQNVSESLDRVVAAALTNPELAGGILCRVALRHVDYADEWANPTSRRNAAMILHAINCIHTRIPPLPLGATAGSPLRAIWQCEVAKLREVTPSTILKYLTTNNVESLTATGVKEKPSPETLAALSEAGLEEKPSSETLLQIKAYLAEIITPASTANLGLATEQILAGAFVDEDDAAYDLDKWRSEISNVSYHGVGEDSLPAEPTVLDCFAGVSLGRLAAAPKTEIDYLVEGLVVRGQPLLTLAHEKTLKSSIMMDMLVSIATGKPFLNHFAVPSRQNVLYLSGENGEDSTLEVFRRVCDAKGIDADKVEGFTFATWLPKFDRPSDLDELARRTKDADAKFVVADPAGMSISPGAATIVSIAYGELRAVTDAVKRCGATFASVHHATKGGCVTRSGLRSAAGAGWGEWARQWLLLDRVGQFKHETGEHRIKVVSGGSRGHSGRWTLEVREGNIADAGGRVWNVKVTPVGEKVQGLSDQKVAGDADKVLAAMQEIGKPATAKSIRTKAGSMNSAVFAAAIAHLLDGDAVRPLTLEVRGVEREAYGLIGSDSASGAA